MSNGTANQASAILWDFGGVFTSSPFEAFNVLEARLGVPANFIRQTNAINPESNAWAQFESNSVSLDQFDELFAEESEARGYRIPGKEVIAVLSGTLRPRMIDVLKECKKHYQVACITNNVKAGEGPAWPARKTKPTPWRKSWRFLIWWLNPALKAFVNRIQKSTRGPASDSALLVLTLSFSMI